MVEINMPNITLHYVGLSCAYNVLQRQHCSSHFMMITVGRWQHSFHHGVKFVHCRQMYALTAALYWKLAT